LPYAAKVNPHKAGLMPGGSAAIESQQAVIPQYKALLYGVITASSTPCSPGYTPAEKSIHKMINRKVI